MRAAGHGLPAAHATQGSVRSANMRRAHHINIAEHMIFGEQVIFFLIVEPHGLARLWQIGKEKLRLWPFAH